MTDTAYCASRYRVPELDHAYGEGVHLLDDPLLWTLLGRLGAPETGQPALGRLVRMVYESLARAVVAAEFPRARVKLRTRMAEHHPEASYDGLALDRATRAVTVGIARAGTVPSQVVYELLNEVLDPQRVRQDHLSMSRATNDDGEVVGADWHDAKIGRDIDGCYVLFPDPMGATGSSMVSALSHYKEALNGKPRKLVAMHLMITPEYIRALKDAHPDAEIYSCRLDRGLSSPRALASKPGTFWEEERGLNATQYIVPGAGGVGELLNNTWV